MNLQIPTDTFETDTFTYLLATGLERRRDRESMQDAGHLIAVKTRRHGLPGLQEARCSPSLSEPAVLQDASCTTDRQI